MPVVRSVRIKVTTTVEIEYGFKGDGGSDVYSCTRMHEPRGGSIDAEVPGHVDSTVKAVALVLADRYDRTDRS